MVKRKDILIGGSAALGAAAVMMDLHEFSRRRVSV